MKMCFYYHQNVTEAVPKNPIHNVTALMQEVTWCRPDDRPLSEPMMVVDYLCIYASLGLNELTSQLIYLSINKRDSCCRC